MRSARRNANAETWELYPAMPLKRTTVARGRERIGLDIDAFEQHAELDDYGCSARWFITSNSLDAGSIARPSASTRDRILASNSGCIVISAGEHFGEIQFPTGKQFRRKQILVLDRRRVIAAIDPGSSSLWIEDPHLFASVLEISRDLAIHRFRRV